MSEENNPRIIIDIEDIEKFKNMSDEEIKMLFEKQVISKVLDNIKTQKEDTCVLIWKYRF